MTDLSKWDSDNTLYLFTSLTAGSTHVVTATSRIETILRANRIPFTYIDTATNEEARKLYSRRAGGKKFPLLVKEGYVLGGITEVEEWNEFGELHDEIGEVATVNTSIVTAPQNADFKSPYGDPKASAPVASSGSSVASKKTDSTKENIPALSEEAQLAMARASSEIASIASEKKKAPSIASTKTTQSKSTPDADTTLVDRTSTSAPRSSSESAPKAIFHEVPAAGTKSTSSHRGSSISAAEDEEIKAVEEASTIPEDKEKEEGPGQSVSASGTADAAPAKEKDDSAKSANTPAVSEEDAESVKPAPAAEENKDAEKEAAKAAEPSPTPAAEEQQQQQQQTEKAEVTEGQDKAAEETVDTSKQKAGKGEQAGESVVD